MASLARIFHEFSIWPATAPAAIAVPPRTACVGVRDQGRPRALASKLLTGAQTDGCSASMAVDRHGSSTSIGAGGNQRDVLLVSDADARHVFVQMLL